METFFGIDLVELLKTVGYLGIFAIIFAESGLFFGVFLPGDSLLFTAGFLASTGIFNLPLLIVICFAGAVLGDNFGYTFGRRVGPLLFRREDSFWFKKDHLRKAGEFYEKHGGKTIILARFIPIIRTFAPIIAGAGNMDYRSFFFYNLLGGFLWTVGLLCAGYFLGELIPDVDKYLLPIVLLIIIVSLLPTFWHIGREYLTKFRKS